MYTSGSQAHDAYPNLDQFKCTCNLSALKYKLQLKFAVEKDIYIAATVTYMLHFMFRVDKK